MEENLPREADLAACIAQRREVMNLSREDLADKSGIPLATIEKIEKGEYSSYDMDLLNKLGAALHVRFMLCYKEEGPEMAARQARIRFLGSRGGRPYKHPDDT